MRLTQWLPLAELGMYDVCCRLHLGDRGLFLLNDVTHGAATACCSSRTPVSHPLLELRPQCIWRDGPDDMLTPLVRDDLSPRNHSTEHVEQPRGLCTSCVAKVPSPDIITTCALHAQLEMRAASMPGIESSACYSQVSTQPDVRWLCDC